VLHVPPHHAPVSNQPQRLALNLLSLSAVNRFLEAEGQAGCKGLVDQQAFNLRPSRIEPSNMGAKVAGSA
jgi:hypothetical protein